MQVVVVVHTVCIVVVVAADVAVHSKQPTQHCSPVCLTHQWHHFVGFELLKYWECFVVVAVAVAVVVLAVVGVVDIVVDMK